MKKVDVAIVGGGPGGLAAAHSILRAKPNAKVAVLEKRPELIKQGAGMVLLPNGLRALGSCCPEALSTVMARKRNSALTKIVNGMTGEEKTISGNPSWDEKERKYGIPPRSIAWYQLQQDLARELPPDVLSLGSCVTSMEDVDHGVNISVAGSEREDTIQASLVIGADGFFSRVRARILNDGSPSYAGSRLWRALVPRQTEGFTSYVYTAKNFTFLYYAVDESIACWTVSKLMPEPKQTNRNSMQGDSAEKFGEKALEEVVENIKDDLNPQLLDIITATDPKSVTTHGVYIRDPFTNNGNDLWKPATGPYTLLGDAAHPMRPVGQGTSMALEDAAELAFCVEDFGLTPLALREYEKRRIPRASVVAQSSQIGAMKSYSEKASEAEQLQIRALPAYLRVQNYSADMDMEDWINDVSFPDFNAKEGSDCSDQSASKVIA